MKNSGRCKQEEETATTDLVKLINRLVSKQSGNQSFERINLGGKNVGASMSVRHSSRGKSPSSCNIEIYINNNVQGVNNSILLGSEVRMGDPGVCLSMEGVKIGKGYLGRNRKRWGFRLGFLGMFLVVVIAISLLLFVLGVSLISNGNGKLNPWSSLIPC